jgi:hypothetical protein
MQVLLKHVQLRNQVTEWRSSSTLATNQTKRTVCVINIVRSALRTTTHRETCCRFKADQSHSPGEHHRAGGSIFPARASCLLHHRGAAFGRVVQFGSLFRGFRFSCSLFTVIVFFLSCVS